MEITIERLKLTKQYTISRLYESTGRKFFVLDVVEPPISGLADEGPRHEPPTHLAFNRGKYKIFLKPDRDNVDLAVTFMKVMRRERMGLARLEMPQLLSEISFDSPNKVFRTALWCGVLKEKGRILTPDRENFNRFLMRLIMAKQQREIIHVIIR